jgi:exopolysaccharide biosynthesis polyprenyl glycosylphosphotransferase
MVRLFRVFMPLGTVTLLVVEVLLSVSAFVLASFLTIEADPSVYLLFDGGIGQIALVVASIVLGIHFQDLYSLVRVKSRIQLLQKLCLVIGVAFLVQGLVSSLDMQLRMPIRMMLVGSAIALVSIYIWRLLFRRYWLLVVGNQSMLLYGGGGVLETLGRYVEERPYLGLAIAGYVDDVHSPGDVLPGGKVLGRAAEFREIVDAVRPDRIVVSIPGRWPWAALDDLLHMQLAGLLIEDATDTYERLTSRVFLEELKPLRVICSEGLDPLSRHTFYQDVTGMALSVVALAVTLPLTLAIAVAIKLNSPGPVLERQRRAGLDGKLFTRFKFRTTRQDAPAAGGDRASGDPRVTRIGRLLRRHRLDALPEFINVLRGEMALVGPGPERPEFVEAISRQIPFYGERTCVRPGITGWAQVNEPPQTAMEDTLEKLAYDLYYIKNRSQSLDTYILVHTLKSMLVGREA